MADALFSLFYFFLTGVSVGGAITGYMQGGPVWITAICISLSFFPLCLGIASAFKSIDGRNKF